MAEATKEVKGTAWLAEHVNDVCGTDYDNYKIRILLRQLVKDGVVVREEGRYSFAGPNDPTVKQVVKAVKGGAVEKAQADKVASLKDRRSAKKASAVEEEEEKPARRSRTARKAATATEAPARKRTRKAPVEEVEEDEDLDIDEI